MRVSLSETRRRALRCLTEWGLRGRRSWYCTQLLAQHPARATLGAGSRHSSSHAHPVRMDVASPTPGTEARVRSRASGREREKAVDARGDSDPQCGSGSMPAARPMRVRVSEGTRERGNASTVRAKFLTDVDDTRLTVALDRPTVRDDSTKFGWIDRWYGMVLVTSERRTPVPTHAWSAVPLAPASEVPRPPSLTPGHQRGTGARDVLQNSQYLAENQTAA